MDKVPTNIREEGAEKISTKEEIDFIFEHSPELALVGTKEEYVQYLETIFPESKINKIVFHQTDSDWYKTEGFKKEKMGKTDYGYYGKGFYFSSIKDHIGGYGSELFGSLLDIRNPKYNVDTHTVGKQILSGLNKEESIGKSIAWLEEQIRERQKDLDVLKAGNIYKHSDIPPGVDFEVYWEEQRQKRIEAITGLIEMYQDQLLNIDNLVNEYYSYDGFLTSDTDFSYYQEIMVREPNQIHILGSKDDIESFKTFKDSRV